MTRIVPVLDHPVLGHIGVETQDDVGHVIDRRVIRLGDWVDGVWHDTDVSAETDAVQLACKEAWTPKVVRAYKAAFPWVNPGPELLTRLRSTRDSQLAATDWTQLADSPVDKARWAIYRQQLRDLPANTPDPKNPTWPKRPDDPDTQAAERELDRAARTVLFDGKN